MLRWIIGNVDQNSAAVLIVLGICACVIVTSWIVRRRSRVDIEHDFELAKMKQRDAQAIAEGSQRSAHELQLAKIGSNRDIEMKRIEGGMITSHTSKTEVQDG